jgi:hypothetical protein
MSCRNWEGSLKVRHGPALLQTSAAILWGTTITTDAAGVDDRVWLPLLAAAAVASLGALLHYLITRWIKASQALTRAVLTRPLGHDDTGPLAVITTGPIPKISLLPAPGAAPAARRKQRGQHASR